MSPEAKRTIEAIRESKRQGLRPKPSSSFIDSSPLLNPQLRMQLMDRVAALVDENVFGRAEMCIQFALLTTLALRHLNIDAKCVAGEAVYFQEGRRVFSWGHAWVRIGDEVIDGNVDSIPENPMVFPGLSIRPYWGDVSSVPRDRKLRKDILASIPPDPDVDQIWWPELRVWLDSVKE